MDYKTVRKNVTNYYYLNGEIVDIKTQHIVTDENVRVEVMASIFAHNEARRLFRQAIDKSESIDQLTDSMLAKYALNGEKNEHPENKLVWSILESDGHVEEEFYDHSATGYTFLTGENKDFALAAIRYLARKEGFDIENFEVTTDSSQFKETGKSKIIINFTKAPVLSERTRPIENVDENIDHEVQEPKVVTIPQEDGTEKPLSTEDQLAMARKEGNIAMIKYWEAKLEKERLAASQNDEKADEPFVKESVAPDIDVTTGSDRKEPTVDYKTPVGSKLDFEPTPEPPKDIPKREETRDDFEVYGTPANDNLHNIGETFQAAKEAFENAHKKLSSIWSTLTKKMKKSNPNVVISETPDPEFIKNRIEACRKVGDTEGEAFWTGLQKLSQEKDAAEAKMTEITNGVVPMSSPSERMALVRDQLDKAKLNVEKLSKDSERWDALIQYLSSPEKQGEMPFLKSQRDSAREIGDEATTTKWDNEIIHLMLGEYPVTEMDKADFTRIITAIDRLPDEQRVIYANEQSSLAKDMLTEASKNVNKLERVLYLETPKGKEEMNYLQGMLAQAKEASDELSIKKWQDEITHLLTGEYPQQEQQVETDKKNSL